VPGPAPRRGGRATTAADALRTCGVVVRRGARAGGRSRRRHGRVRRARPRP
jgi:hypothetical protein